jgi:hypothetical protein
MTGRRKQRAQHPTSLIPPGGLKQGLPAFPHGKLNLQSAGGPALGEPRFDSRCANALLAAEPRRCVPIMAPRKIPETTDSSKSDYVPGARGRQEQQARPSAAGLPPLQSLLGPSRAWASLGSLLEGDARRGRQFGWSGARRRGAASRQPPSVTQPLCPPVPAVLQTTAMPLLWPSSM